MVNFVKEKKYELPGMTMEISNGYDEWNSCLLTTLKYTKDGRHETHRFKHYFYTISEIRRLLAKFNLQTTALYSSTDKPPFRFGDPQVYIVAQKN